MTLSSRNASSFLLVFAAIAVPPLSPFAPGPSPNGVSLLLGGSCLAVFVAACRGSCIRPAVWAWIFAAVVGAVMGLLQYFNLAEHFAPWISAAETGEAYGNFRQRNLFATFTNIGLAALGWMTIDTWRHASSRNVGRVSVVALAAGLLVVANAASSSRTGLLQLLMVIALAIAWLSPRRKVPLIGGIALIAVYVVAALLLPWLLEWSTGVSGHNVFMRLVQSEGCSSRTVLWSNVLHLIAERPLWGWGAGELDYAHYATLYDGERFCAILDNAHNLPLHIAVEFGVPAAVIFLGAVFWLVWRAKPWSASTPFHRLAWTVLALIAVHSLVEYPLWYSPFLMAVGVCCAMLLAREETLVPTPARHDRVADDAGAAAHSRVRFRLA